MSELYDIYKGSKQTGAFGEERSYYKKGKSHEGVDLAKPLNSPINSRYDGTVIRTGYDKNGYGNYIDVLHGETQDGKPIVTRYAHANKLSKKVGDKVTSGEVLGAVGSTGRSTGPHLHTELIVGGQKFNPMDLQKNITNMLEGKMAMQPKGSVQNDKQAIDNVISELATESANAQLSSPELDALKKQTFQAILSKLQQPVQYPKEVTISDILQGNSLGDRMKLYSEYLKTPQAQRNIGSLIGPKVFNERTGRFESTGEMLGREAEARLNAEKERAMEQEKIQTGLASNAFRAINEVEAEQLRNDRDIARLNQQNEQFLQKMDYDREVRKAEADALANKIAKQDAQQAFENNYKLASLNENIRHNKEQENINKQKQASKANKYKQAFKDIDFAINQANDLIKMIDANPKAIGYWVGSLAKGNTLSQKIANKQSTDQEIATRAAIAKLRGTTLHDLTGSAQTLVEIQNLAPSLADATDDPKTAKAKLNQLIKELKNKKATYNSALDDEDFNIDINITPQSNVKVKSWKVVK